MPKNQTTPKHMSPATRDHNTMLMRVLEESVRTNASTESLDYAVLTKLAVLDIGTPWALFCRDLLKLDDIATTEEAFIDFCVDLHALDRDVNVLMNSALGRWNARMKTADFKQAAVEFATVVAGFEHAVETLGKNGAKRLSQLLFKNSTHPMPQHVHLVWNYIDWKVATSSFNKSEKKNKIKTPHDKTFTVENVAMNEEIRIAVIIGVEAMKIL